MKIGDRVKVLDTGGQFSTYDEFFTENNLKHLLPKYKYGVGIRKGDILQVIAIGNHRNHYPPVLVLEKPNGDIYIINEQHCGKTYLELLPLLPEFKVGDKVVPVSKSFGRSLGDAIKECGYNGEYITVRGLLESGRIDTNIGVFEPSDLRPYDDYADYCSRIEACVAKAKEAKTEQVPQFKVGDRVKCVKNETLPSRDLYQNTGVIIRLDNPTFPAIHWDNPIINTKTGYNFAWHEGKYNNVFGVATSELELYIPTNLAPNPRTETAGKYNVITFDDNMTRFLHDRGNGRRFIGEAFCAPGDVFDEKKGIDIARSRAMQAYWLDEEARLAGRG